MVKIERKDLTQAKVHEYFKYDDTLDEAKLARTEAEYKYDFHINHGIIKPL